MGKFKEFLLNEEIGLGNLGNKIDKFYSDPDLQNKINGAFVSSYWNNTNYTPWRGEGSLQNVKIPVDLVIPQVERSGRIAHINKKQNPIVVELSDGTKCFFTQRQFKGIEGNPEIGKVMTVRIQRNPQDTSNNFSKIEKITIVN